jgi:hypothetical protein
MRSRSTCRRMAIRYAEGTVMRLPDSSRRSQRRSRWLTWCRQQTEKVAKKCTACLRDNECKHVEQRPHEQDCNQHASQDKKNAYVCAAYLLRVASVHRRMAGHAAPENKLKYLFYLHFMWFQLKSKVSGNARHRAPGRTLMGRMHNLGPKACHAWRLIGVHAESITVAPPGWDSRKVTPWIDRPFRLSTILITSGE